MLITALIAATLSVATMHAMAAMVGIGLWFVCLGGLRMMAKADPRMRVVFLRALRYKGYYPAGALDPVARGQKG